MIHLSVSVNGVRIVSHLYGSCSYCRTTKSKPTVLPTCWCRCISARIPNKNFQLRRPSMHDKGVLAIAIPEHCLKQTTFHKQLQCHALNFSCGEECGWVEHVSMVLYLTLSHKRRTTEPSHFNGFWFLSTACRVKASSHAYADICLGVQNWNGS